VLKKIKKIINEYQKLKYLAYHDSLTGLYNRNWLYENENKIKANYVYFIDINNLHKINELGHIHGDEYIKKIISRLKDKGVLVRYAGDEFILFSDEKNIIYTNNYFSVGMKKVDGDVKEAIAVADLIMLGEKRIWKEKNKFVVFSENNDTA
jgi:diguanylate cyclase (GGDEF)-like protein